MGHEQSFVDDSTAVGSICSIRATDGSSSTEEISDVCNVQPVARHASRFESSPAQDPALLRTALSIVAGNGPAEGAPLPASPGLRDRADNVSVGCFSLVDEPSCSEASGFTSDSEEPQANAQPPVNRPESPAIYQSRMSLPISKPRTDDTGTHTAGCAANETTPDNDTSNDTDALSSDGASTIDGPAPSLISNESKKGKDTKARWDEPLANGGSGKTTHIPVYLIVPCAKDRAGCPTAYRTVKKVLKCGPPASLPKVISGLSVVCVGLPPGGVVFISIPFPSVGRMLCEDTHAEYATVPGIAFVPGPTDKFGNPVDYVKVEFDMLLKCRHPIPTQVAGLPVIRISLPRRGCILLPVLLDTGELASQATNPSKVAFGG